MSGRARTLRENVSWIIALGVLFPVTLLLAYSLQSERQQQFRLENERAMWFSAVERSKSGVALIEAPSGHIVFWNRGAEELLGWTSTDVSGKSFLFMLPEELREMHEKIMHDQARLESLKRQVIHLKCVMLDKQNNPQLLLLTIRSTENAFGQYGFILTFDLTSRVIPLDTSNQFQVPK